MNNFGICACRDLLSVPGQDISLSGAGHNQNANC